MTKLNRPSNTSFLRIVFAATLFFLLHTSLLWAQDTAKQLITEMGCAGCHTTLPYPHSLNKKIPDLKQAGSRYYEGYLFEYLKDPQRIRRHLGAARMPNFQLTDEEALALTQYLSTQNETPDINLPDNLDLEVPRSLKITSSERFTQFMNKQALCITCHSFGERKAYLAAKMDDMGARLKPGFLKRYLAAPDKFGIKSELMPAQFYQPSEAGGKRIPVGENPAMRINRIAGFLHRSGKALRDSQEKAYQAAMKRYPDSTPEMGKKIFVALNCAGCHQAETVARKNAAPDLMITGSRVKQKWLNHYLKESLPLRRAGYHPGDGSRMPYFNLSDEEANQISNYLMQQKRSLPKADIYKTLSPSQIRKGRFLLSNKLSCLGCHQFHGEGGIIGPDLEKAARRLQPDYIDVMISNPRLLAGHSVMPQIQLPAKDRKLLISLLLIENKPGIRDFYLPLTKLLSTKPGDTQGAKQYAYYCAPCHGNSGKADGFNASFLPQKPTSFENKEYMSSRNDGTLYDGIYAGGYILNKHHFMPPWRTLFSDEEIRDLVAFIRKLCDCEEPDWANGKKERRE